VDALDSMDLDGDVDMEREGEDEEEEDQEEEEEDKDEDKDEDEDDGKEPWRIGQGKMVNTSADDVDAMIDDQPTMLPEKGQEMREHTTWPKPLAPAPRPQTMEPYPRP